VAVAVFDIGDAVRVVVDTFLAAPVSAGRRVQIALEPH